MMIPNRKNKKKKVEKKQPVEMSFLFAGNWCVGIIVIDDIQRKDSQHEYEYKKNYPCEFAKTA